MNVIVSKSVDVAMVLVPFMVASAALLLFGVLGIDEPLWAYLAFFVSFDVAHVWATAYLTYFDAASFKKRKWLYTIPLPAFFIGAFILHLVSPTALWSGVAYFAIVHFAKQQYGFIAIYKAKARERDRLDYRLDKFTLWTGAFGPVLIWHAQPKGQFDWWNNGERFLITLPPGAQWVIAVMMCATAVVYIARQLQLAGLRRFNFGKNLWMTASWTSWIVGLMLAENLLVSAAFINLFHGLPFLVLVWKRGQTKYRDRTRGFAAWVFRKKNWLIFYGVILALALVEETLWDAFVWQTYWPTLFGENTGPKLSHLWLSLMTAALLTPQLVHYFLDAFLWKFNDHNHDLKEALGFAKPEGS